MFDRIVRLMAVGMLAVACTMPEQHHRIAANPEQHTAIAPRSIANGPDEVRAFPAPPAGFDEARPGVAAGSLVEFGYDSAVTGTRRLASVYLPAGFTEQRRYPVLYLLHGLAGTHSEWPAYVRAAPILDQLIAAGRRCR